MNLVTFVLCIFSTPRSDAMMPCGLRAPPSRFGRDLIRKVGYYDNIKPSDAESFASQNSLTASEVEEKFSGTGIFVCENGWGNGQVIGNRRTVTTVLHTFLKDMDDCSKPRALDKCAFVYNVNGKRTRKYAKRIVATGGCSKGSKLEAGNDWAIVELKQPLPTRIKPYEIPNQNPLAIGQQVTMVGRTTGYNPLAVKGDLDMLPQAYANCTPLGSSNFHYAGEVQSNCPSAKGSSGSGVFSSGPSPVFAGLITGDIPTQDVCVPTQDPTNNDGPFEMNCRGSLIIPASGRFLDALRGIK